MRAVVSHLNESARAFLKVRYDKLRRVNNNFPPVRGAPLTR